MKYFGQTALEQFDEIIRVNDEEKGTQEREIFSFQSIKEMSSRLGKTYEELKEEVSRGNLLYYNSGNKIYIPSNVDTLMQCSSLHNEMKKNIATKITIGVSKGGVCKTTATANLGVSLAFLGKKVLLVDGDPSQCNLSSIFGANNIEVNKRITENNIVSLLKDAQKNIVNEEKINNSIVSINVENKFNGGKLDILPACFTMVDDTRDIDPNRGKHCLNKILDGLLEDYDFILIDTPPSPTDAMIDLAIYASDYFLLSILSEKTTADGIGGVLKPIFNINEMCGRDCKVLGGLFNKFMKRMNNTKVVGEGSIQKLVEYTGNNNLVVDAISNSPKIAETQLKGGVMLFLDPHSVVTREYIEVAVKIMLNTLTIEKGD